MTYGGGSSDAFVAKVSADGTALEYCGYIGGGGNDQGRGIAVDDSGNAYVTGYTSSTQSQDFPVWGGPDVTYNGGTADAFVAKVLANGSWFDYCGYIGGSDTTTRTALRWTTPAVPMSRGTRHRPKGTISQSWLDLT